MRNASGIAEVNYASYCGKAAFDDVKGRRGYFVCR